MGMYDYISISADKLNLTLAEISDMRDAKGKIELQTKDFDSEMSLIHLNEDSITIGPPYYAEAEEQKQATVLTDYHGWVTFCGSGTSGWFYEFAAKYTDGKLMEVKRLHESEAFWNKGREKPVRTGIDIA